MYSEECVIYNPNTSFFGGCNELGDRFVAADLF